jgi:aminoglycoside phosphotransferase (APT) family kinase protein
MNWEPSLEALGPVLRDVGAAAPSAITELAGGSNRTVRVDLDGGGAVVLKTYDDLRGKLPTREAYASSLVAGLCLPVTRYLAIDESLARLPVRFAITNHLPGTAVSTLRDEPGIGVVYRDMGVLLRKLQAVALPGYGRFGDGGIIDPMDSNLDRVRADALGVFHRFRAQGGDTGLAAALEAAVEVRLAAATVSTGAVFAHDDLHHGNVLAERDAAGSWRLTGLLDFGNAHAADPVRDLAKVLFMAAHDAPGSEGLIREGYGAIDHPDPETALWVYTLLHRASMWAWLRQIGVLAVDADIDLIRDLRAMVA